MQIKNKREKVQTAEKTRTRTRKRGVRTPQRSNSHGGKCSAEKLRLNLFNQFKFIYFWIIWSLEKVQIKTRKQKIKCDPKSPKAPPISLIYSPSQNTLFAFIFIFIILAKYKYTSKYNLNINVNIIIIFSSM